MSRSLELITAVLIVLGLGLWAVAMVRAGDKQGRAQVLGSLSGGILTGAAVAVGVLVLQQWLAASSEDALWRANVETAADIPGFNPGHHSMQGLDLSSKHLENADLRGKDLRGVQFRDTDLAKALLGHANLHGDVMWFANLKDAELPGADLSGAEIQGVNFEHAAIYSVKSLQGATANEYTCWPAGFFTSPKFKEVKAGVYHDARGHVTWSRGHEYPDCRNPP
jgi:hypothetical protein